MIFRETFSCFDFLYTCVWNISQSQKNSSRYYHKFICVFM